MRSLIKVVLFISVFPLWGQWTMEREVFIPPEYYVGDQVILELLIKLEQPMVLDEPGDLPVVEWLEIQNLNVEQQGDMVQVVLQFRSFYPGTRNLPAIDLGGIRLQGINLFTSSVSEQEGIVEIRGIRDPLQLPGSHLLLLLILLGVIIIPFLLYFLISFSYRRIRHMIRVFRRKAPFRRFSRLLVQLQLKDLQKDIPQFYTRLSVGLRAYLTDRSQVDYNSCTTREMARKIIPGIDRAKWKQILAILKRADMVKYAGETSSYNEMDKNLDFLIDFSKQWEEEEKNAYL